MFLENDAELISLNLHSHKDEHEDNDHGKLYSRSIKS